MRMRMRVYTRAYMQYVRACTHTHTHTCMHACIHQGGVFYAIEGATGKVLSQYDAGSGIQGEPTIGDGFVVFSTCTDLVIFH